MTGGLPKLPKKRGTPTNSYGADPRIDRAVAWWQELAERCGLSRIITVRGTRARHVLARMTEPEFAEQLDALAQKIERSSFLRGANARGWRCDFDFVFGNATNYLKILEGKYDDRSSRQQGGRETFDHDTINRLSELALRSSARGDHAGDHAGRARS